jgi:hypothetical protein
VKEVMRENNCEVVRRELDELMIGEACSIAATEHLRDCASCREFHEQQTKLRQIVGSLGTVEAPADFDFRLRARLAQSNGSVVYWPFARSGLAVAAMVIVFLVGVVVVRNMMNRPAAVNNVAQQPQTPVQPDVAPQVTKEDKKPEQTVAGVNQKSPAIIQRDGGRPRNEFRKRTLSTVDSALSRAEVINGAQPAGLSAAFPIDASPQTFRVSLDDGRGNARTISVPTISFGSQRIVQNGNQIAPKRVW